MEDDTIESKLPIVSIVLMGVGSFLGLLGLILLRNVYVVRCTMEFTPEQLLENKDLLPKYVKVVGKVELTKPLMSRIGKQPNCFKYSSRLTYSYDTKDGVWEPARRNVDENGRVSYWGGYWRTEVNDHSYHVIDEARLVDEFNLVGEDGNSRILVNTDGPITVNFRNCDGRLQHTAKRGKLNSSGMVLTCPQNPNVREQMGTLPAPHKKSSIEIDEEWIKFENDDDRLIQVYGVAKERDGTVIMSAGGLNRRMIIEDGSSKWVLCCIVVWVLTLPTLITGCVMFALRR